ncbi:hypothetical protein [Paenibacillus macquariensis]|uniref:Uncharacterized protein n=1 Tax=Paenibacillus macquariensis TaxID=948756 RepID=A0ABY1KEU4_9BACL|nr:hypothetical protein [Paenibacillus macquariensis]MEC0092474.1 hypothetical protein [Paenibacillus macquariensis]SIR72675.1 hypothetical protein SAMN05421578_14811 [Paenibacillus macquariensis]
MKQKPEMKIVKRTVVDMNGNLLGHDPKEFPILTNKCKAFVLLLETGKEYKVV